MILSGASIRATLPRPRLDGNKPAVHIFEPFCERTLHAPTGTTYGLGVASYDVRVKQGFILRPGGFILASTIERFTMPFDVAGELKDKSTWARRAIAVQNTFIDPGWRGYLTLEISNHGDATVAIPAGAPIAQVVLYRVDGVTAGYDGKYQDQPDRPVGPIFEEAR